MLEVPAIVAVSLYKLATLAVGLSITNMGFKLFLADKNRAAGELEARYDKYALSLKGGAPGVFFSLFGASIVVATVIKGMGIGYDAGSPRLPCKQEPQRINILPATPPRQP